MPILIVNNLDELPPSIASFVEKGSVKPMDERKTILEALESAGVRYEAQDNSLTFYQMNQKVRLDFSPEGKLVKFELL